MIVAEELEAVNSRAVQSNETNARTIETLREELARQDAGIAHSRALLSSYEERETAHARTITALREDNSLLSRTVEEQAEAIIATACANNRLKAMVKSALTWHTAIRLAVADLRDGSYFYKREDGKLPPHEYARKLLLEIEAIAGSFIEAGEGELELTARLASFEIKVGDFDGLGGLDNVDGK